MDIQKINDYIDAYSRAIELPDDYKEILKELMPRIIEKYSKTRSSVSVKEDDYDKYVIKPVNGEYLIEDFFLNRLMRNVWIVDNTQSVAKGDYQAINMCVSLNEERIKRQLDGKEGIDKSRPDFQEIDETARKKVIMHEFEHALQTQFKGEHLDYRFKSIYERIFEEVSKINKGKYADSIQKYEDVSKSGYDIETYIHNGLHYSDIQGKKTYREIKGEINLTEIFNETEAIEMAKAKAQTKHTYPNGVYYIIRNRESSNYPITNYGNILKNLIGDELTFTGMYLNPEELFKTFNTKYNDVFQTMYETDKDAWQILIEQLKLIKDNKNNDKINYSLNQKLQETLARCLEKDIDNELQKGNANTELLKKKIVQFRVEALNADDKETRSKISHFAILKSLKEKVELAYQKQQEGVDEPKIPSEKSSDKKKTRTGDRWVGKTMAEEGTETQNAADKWSTLGKAKRITKTATDKWRIPTKISSRGTIDASDRWGVQPDSTDRDDPTTDTTKGGSGGNFGLAQEMGQTPYQAEMQRRKQEISFADVKRATSQAKITQQEINDETLQIKEREELDMLKKKGLIKTPEERARYTYLKAKYEPPVQSQQKGQTRGQSR